jgi:hypothetical protein
LQRIDSLAPGTGPHQAICVVRYLIDIRALQLVPAQHIVRRMSKKPTRHCRRATPLGSGFVELSSGLEYIGKMQQIDWRERVPAERIA